MSAQLSSREEAALATFFAHPSWPAIRYLVEQIAPGSVAPIEAVMRRVRVEQWRDLSCPNTKEPDA